MRVELVGVDIVLLMRIFWAGQTDDTLPFRNSLLGEYALLMAPSPLGLGLSEPEIERIARMSMQSRFVLPEVASVD